MNAWASASPLVISLGWTLVHFLWQGLLLGAACWLLMHQLRRASASARYWTGMAMLGAMLAAPVATFIHLYEPAVAAAGAAQATAGTWITLVSGDAGPDLVSRVEGLLPWAVVAWLVGVLLNGARLTVDLARVRRLATRELRPLPLELERVVARLKRALGVRDAVRVMESVQVSVPMVVGWLMPIVLIPPSAMMGLTARQLELIISHELAHVRRLDYLFNLMQVLVETLLFYHPAVAYVSRCVRAERENCCDDVVVAHTGDSIAYARALTEVEGLRCSSGMQVAVAATGAHLRGRVQRLVALPAPQRGVVHWVSAVMLVGASLTALTNVDLRPDPPPAPAEAPPPALTRMPAPAPSPAPRAVSGSPAVTDAPPAPAAPGVASDPVPEAAPAASGVSAPAAAPAPPVPVTPADPVSEPRSPAPAVPAATGRVPQTEEMARAGDRSAMSETAAVERPIRTAALDARPQATSGPAPVWDEALGVPRLQGGKLLQSAAPDYPYRARLEGVGGLVKVRYLVDRVGRVRNVEILEASAPGIFDDAVRRALKDWRYQPYTSGGKAVSQLEARTFEFTVDSRAVPADVTCQKVTGSRVCRGYRGYRELGTIVIYNSI